MSLSEPHKIFSSIPFSISSLRTRACACSMSTWIRLGSELTVWALGPAERSVSLANPLPCRLLLPPRSTSSSEFGALVCPDLFDDEALTPGPLHVR